MLIYEMNFGVLLKKLLRVMKWDDKAKNRLI